MRRKRWTIGAALLLISLVGILGCGNNTECGEFPLDDKTRHCIVTTVETMVLETFPFAEYKEVDLDDFSAALWATLEMEADDQAFLTHVAKVVSSLRDGHTRIERRLLETPGVAPVELRRGDEGVFVDRVEDNQWSELVGREVAAIDGVPVDEALSAIRGWTETGRNGEVMLTGLELALAGEAGEEVELSMSDGERVVLRRAAPHTMPEVRRIDDDVAYLRIHTFGYIDDLSRIDEAINEILDARALIIDLRGNGGGYPSVTDGLFGRLVDQEVGDFRLVDRHGELHRNLKAPPRGETFDGEVVILVDTRTYSASNYLAHRMVYHQRGVLVGQRTGGGAASPQRGAMLVPGVWFQVSTHVLYPPSGDHSESGIKPTIAVDNRFGSNGEQEESLSAMNEPPDPVLERALRYLGGLK